MDEEISLDERLEEIKRLENELLENRLVSVGASKLDDRG